MTRRALVALLVLASVSGCTGRSGAVADQGYISGDGTVTTVPAAERSRPVAVSGTTLDGHTWDLRNHRGEVVVVNVWGSWCPPCIAEAPALQAVHEQTTSAGVAFVGINTKDDAAAARAHERRFGVTYPSIDDDGGRVLLALATGRSLPPNAIPSTLVLDRKGRVAARVLGRVERALLAQLVDDVVAERRA